MADNVELCNECSGCGLCTNLCGNGAITLKQNNHGFFEPVVDYNKCVHCRVCEQGCASKNNSPNAIRQVYIAKTKLEELLMSSSSGAVFSGLSEFILSREGIIYGVILNEKFEVVHARAESKRECVPMRGSKYVQSFIGDTLKNVGDDLKRDRDVLFTGTPCQVDALNIYLNTKRIPTQKLLTCEVICNGVSSSKLWWRYINEYLDKSSIADISFRYKHPKIHGSIFAVKKKSGFIDISGYYSQLYTSKNCCAEACYHCQYASKLRNADFSIGDFQGRTKDAIKIPDVGGLSVVLVNSPKAEEVWNKIADNYYTQKIPNDYEQERLISSCKKPDTYDQFWEDEQKMSMKQLLRKYTNKNFIEDVRTLKGGYLLNVYKK